MSNQGIVGFVEDFTDDTEDAPPIPFKIGDEIFYVAGEAPVGALLDISSLAGVDLSTLAPSQAGQAGIKLLGFLDAVMMPESAVRFAARMRTPVKPIKIPQIMKIVRWLVQIYSGKERTAPVSSSPTGQETTGPSSTGGVQQGEPIPASFT